MTNGWTCPDCRTKYDAGEDPMDTGLCPETGRGCTQVTLPDLVSGPEARAILGGGITRQRLQQLSTEHPDFPAPAYRLGAGKIWLRADIEAFAKQWRRRAGRPSKETA